MMHTHVHRWSNGTQCTHCLDCGITLHDYVGDMLHVITSVAMLQWITTQDPQVRHCIELARTINGTEPVGPGPLDRVRQPA